MTTVQGYTALQRRLAAIGDTSALLKSLQVSTVEEAQKNAAPHRKTGHLQRSIVPGSLSKTSAIVEVRVPYAASMEYGARRHKITAKNGKALAFPATSAGRRLSGRPTAAARRGSLGLGGSGGIKLVGIGANSGSMRFYKSVNHPGNRPYPYLIPGAQEAVRKHGAESITKAWNGAA